MGIIILMDAVSRNVSSRDSSQTFRRFLRSFAYYVFMSVSNISLTSLVYLLFSRIDISSGFTKKKKKNL